MDESSPGMTPLSGTGSIPLASDASEAAADLDPLGTGAMSPLTDAIAPLPLPLAPVAAAVEER